MNYLKKNIKYLKQISQKHENIISYLTRLNEKKNKLEIEKYISNSKNITFAKSLPHINVNDYFQYLSDNGVNFSNELKNNIGKDSFIYYGIKFFNVFGGIIPWSSKNE